VLTELLIAVPPLVEEARRSLRSLISAPWMNRLSRAVD